MTYTLMPMDWDENYKGLNTKLKELFERKVFCPCDIDYLVQITGALPHKKEVEAKSFAKDLKEKWPFVKFCLFKGDTWGSLELVEEF